MINFPTLQGLTIPEGVVTQIADASGRVIWAVRSGGKVVLKVEKVTSNTKAGETTYTDEQFILFDIYPKTNGTVKITYCGLPKTITDTSGAEAPNAQQVFFGTFNGVSDSVETPASGELTIEGDYYAFGQGSWSQGSKIDVASVHIGCIKEIVSFGKPTEIPYLAFTNCTELRNVEIPNGVVRILPSAFSGCYGLASVTIPDGVTDILQDAFFYNKTNALKTVTIHSTTPPQLNPDYGGRTFGNPTSEYFVLEKIIVPKGCGNAYKTADGWSTYVDYIVEAS